MRQYDDCETTDLVAKSIESQQDFENKVTGSCNPQIDFYCMT